jgi:hypothetical protein
VLVDIRVLLEEAIVRVEEEARLLDGRAADVGVVGQPAEE